MFTAHPRGSVTRFPHHTGSDPTPARGTQNFSGRPHPGLNATDFCLPPNPNLSFFTLKPSAPSLPGCRLRKPSSQQLLAPFWLFLGFLSPFPDPFFPFPSHGRELRTPTAPLSHAGPKTSFLAPKPRLVFNPRGLKTELGCRAHATPQAPALRGGYGGVLGGVGGDFVASLQPELGT